MVFEIRGEKKDNLVFALGFQGMSWDTPPLFLCHSYSKLFIIKKRNVIIVGHPYLRHWMTFGKMSGEVVVLYVFRLYSRPIYSFTILNQLLYVQEVSSIFL